MAGSKAKLTKKQVDNLMRVTTSIALGDPVPSCEALYAAAEAIAQLITIHCPIASPPMSMRKATKKASKK